MAKQLEIDWTRARQLMVLSAAEVADAAILEGGRPRRVKAVVLKAVLTTTMGEAELLGSPTRRSRERQEFHLGKPRGRFKRSNRNL